MKPRTKVTIEDVRDSLDTSVPTHISVRLFARPVSNLITPFFHNTGWTANGVTVARIPLAIAGVSLLAIPNPQYWMFSAVIFYVCYVLDCVDGNLARIQNDASYLGKFLDGISDAIYGIFVGFSMGIGLWLYLGETTALFIGAFATIASIVNHYLRSRLSFFAGWMVSLTGPLTEAELSAARRPRAIQEKCSGVSVNSFFFVFLALFVPHWGGLIFLSLLVVTRLIPDIIWIYTTFAESNALLRRPRISRHSRIKPDDDAAPLAK